MNKTTFFLSILLTASSFAFGQDDLQAKDDIAKSHGPVDGKAVVYILRPTSYARLMKMNIDCDGVHIGFSARTSLKLLDEEEGKKFLSKCRLSRDNVYSE